MIGTILLAALVLIWLLVAARALEGAKADLGWPLPPFVEAICLFWPIALFLGYISFDWDDEE